MIQKLVKNIKRIITLIKTTISKFYNRMFCYKYERFDFTKDVEDMTQEELLELIPGAFYPEDMIEDPKEKQDFIKAMNFMKENEDELNLIDKELGIID